MFYVQQKEELISMGDQLLKGGWRTMNKIDRENLIERFCRGYFLPPLDNHSASIFRARAHAKEPFFSHVRELMAPPAEYVGIGRLNRAHSSILYLSGTPTGAISEVKPRIGDVVSVLACRMRPGSKPFSVAPLALTQLSPSRVLGPVGEISRGGALTNPFFAAILEQKSLTEQWIYQEYVISHLITLSPSPEDRTALYEITNHIADHLYEFATEFEGVRYPGITAGLSTLNLAIHEQRWADVEPLQVWIVSVDDYFSMKLNDKPTLATNPLLWHGFINQDGSITYNRTESTLLSAWSEFKQQCLQNYASPDGLQPVLTKPYVRHRIRWQSSPRNYDFTLPNFP